MKTVTITLHDTENCGSSLQAFALQQYLKSIDIDNEIINYVPAYFHNGGHPVRAFVRKSVFFKEALIHRRKFKAFIQNYLTVTGQKYVSLEQLKRNPPLADCYITGSDQLWNSMYACGSDPAFYLDFVDGRKIAYAVSLGREVIPNDNINIIKRYIHNFDCVSVREKSSISQIEKLYRREVSYVCDPVLLNPVSVYDQIMAKRMIPQAYILVYVAQDIIPTILNSWIEKVCRRCKKAVVFIGSYRSKCKCDYHIRNAAPEEFLSLIYYADYVISNSFHATLFSLMYHKQFATITPEENGARMQSILVDVGLKDHAVSQDGELPDDITDEYYIQVQGILNDFSGASQAWLKNALKVGK